MKDRKASEGALVLQEVVQMTGLPKDYVDREVGTGLGTPEGSVNNLTLDQLRIVMLNYLEAMNEEMNAEFAKAGEENAASPSHIGGFSTGAVERDANSH